MTRQRPKLLGSADVAKALGWDTRRARRWLRRTGAGEKRGGRIVTTAAKLVAHFPEAYHEISTSEVDDG